MKLGIIVYYYFLKNAEKQHNTGNYIIKRTPVKVNLSLKISKKGKISSGCKNIYMLIFINE